MKAAADSHAHILGNKLQATGRRVIVPTTRRIVVIAKLRPFDEMVWKRLLIAYAYALYDKQKRAKQAVAAGGGGAQ